MAFFVELPDEILLQTFARLSLKDVLNCLSTCSRLFKFLDQSFWRSRCIRDFDAWDERHSFQILLKKPPGNHDWQSLYKARLQAGKDTQEALNSMLASTSGHLKVLSGLIDYGEDIKDVLVQNMLVSSNAPDVLSRRWYARATHGWLQRSKAIQIWRNMMQNPGSVPLVQALLAFDMFILNDKAIDYIQISWVIDSLAIAITAAASDWDTVDSREKALRILQYLVDNQLVGIQEGRRFLDVRNSSISLALACPKGSSLPLISSAIYCAVAQKLGINARLCAFPMHVFVVVSAKEGFKLDDEPITSEADRSFSSMYLDPFRGNGEVSRQKLIDLLPAMGISAASASEWLQPADNFAIVERCARNILAAFNRSELLEDTDPIDRETIPQAGQYAAIWALMLMRSRPSDPDLQSQERRRRHILNILDYFVNSYRFDANTAEKYLLPLSEFAPPYERLVREQIKGALVRDLKPQVPQLRTPSRNGVSFRVGQLFKHKRYSYVGLIHGWDIECNMSEHWVGSMGVDDLEHGRSQPFYHAMTSNYTNTYVAQDNIEIISPLQPPPSILRQAGQYFKRWDPASRTFISNVKDSYPDD